LRRFFQYTSKFVCARMSQLMFMIYLCDKIKHMTCFIMKESTISLLNHLPFTFSIKPHQQLLL
jgi:hypothetical protein